MSKARLHRVFQLAIDMLGFYWPRGNKTLVGGIINGGADFYEVANVAEINIYNSLYAFSTMHFLTHEIGQGPFVRADVGLALLRAEITSDESEIEEVEAESDWGVGFLLGGGYGIPVTSGTPCHPN